jgi:hypothetical protein
MASAALRLLGFKNLNLASRDSKVPSEAMVDEDHLMAAPSRLGRR